MSDILIESNCGEDHDDPHFILQGDIDLVLNNKRLVLALKRFGFTLHGSTIRIPFEDRTQISILQSLQKVLNKFDIQTNISSDLKNEVGSFDRENELFNLFTQKAQAIRNDQFKQYPELVKDFEGFKNVLKQKLERRLYPLQLLSAFHMAFSQNSCNFAVPGAGKTSIVYGAYCYLKSLSKDDPRKVDKLLVVGPISSFAPWEKEYSECFGQQPRSKRLSGDVSITRDQKVLHLYSPNPAELTLIYHGGLDSLQNEIIDFLKAHRTLVVIDEAHRIKNPDGVWGRSSIEISKEAKSRVILTGTPVPNGYEDLFNLFRFIYPFKFKEVLGYHYPNLMDMTKNNDPESPRVQQFTENISPYFIRIKKKDLKLPPREERFIRVNMAPQQREIYDFIETRYMDAFELNPNGTIKDVLNRAKMIRLRQASTNPILLAKPLKEALANDTMLDEVDPNARFAEYSDEFIDDSEFFEKVSSYYENETPIKFTEIEKLLTSQILANNEKVIIWTIFIQNSKDLQAFLLEHGIESKLLIGEVPQYEREDTISKFNNPNNTDFSVVIANPFSVAESISLHKGCHNAIYMERDYNCSNFLQSKDRIHRVGLAEGQITCYYYIIAKDSIDSVIDQRLKVKIERMEAIIDHDIPLLSRIDDTDETDLIKALMKDYAQRT